MDQNKREALRKTAQGIISKLELRGMEGRYFETVTSVRNAILQEIPAGSSVTWGGSMTLSEIELFDAMKEAPFTLLDRDLITDPAEKRAFYAKQVMADYFLMSSNAITLNGELVNIDGAGNRVACLITGPKNVIMVVGMNKVEVDVESAVKRVRNVATPANVIRLHKNTPCASSGRCADCLVDDCICAQVVVTRKSMIKGRIKVFLVGENLGY